MGVAITLKQVNDNDASVKIGHNGDIFISAPITECKWQCRQQSLLKVESENSI